MKNCNWELVGKIEKRYDSRNKLIYESINRFSKLDRPSIDMNLYIYRSDGLLAIKSEDITRMGKKRVTTYKYDCNKNLIREKVIIEDVRTEPSKVDDAISETIDHIYDGKTLVETVRKIYTRVLDDGHIVPHESTYVTKYNSDGQKTIKTLNAPHLAYNGTEIVWKYDYDERGNLIKKYMTPDSKLIKTFMLGGTTQYVIYQYNDYNDIIKRIEKFHNGHPFISIETDFEYTYNDRGYIIERYSKSIETIDFGTYTIYTKTVYEYDDNDNVIYEYTYYG